LGKPFAKNYTAMVSAFISSSKLKLTNPKLTNPMETTTMQITIELPEALAPYFQSQLSTDQYPTLSAYIQALIIEDLTRRARLESKLLEALDSPATPMTDDDWAYIRTQVRQNLSQAPPHA
jgi:Arc/MetJ-type ribon-helix-helix transcriptional regulator